MDIDLDPVKTREDNLAAMLAGQWDGVSADDAHRATEAARENMNAGFGGRTLGFGVITSHGVGDTIEYLVAVTDGTRQAAIRAALSRTRATTVEAAGEHPDVHIIERLTGAAGNLPNNSQRYENIVLQEQPILFT